MDARHSLQNQAFTALSVAEATTLDALFEQLFPADENGPGASSIGVTQYLDQALSGPYAHHLETYRLGVFALDAESERRFGKTFCRYGWSPTERTNWCTGTKLSAKFPGNRSQSLFRIGAVPPAGRSFFRPCLRGQSR